VITQPSSRLTEIRQNLVKGFSLEEFRILCSDLDISFDNLLGETYEGKVNAMLVSLEHRSRTAILQELLQKRRPDVDWTPLCVPEEGSPPFKGLAYYDVNDADLFFGREALVQKLIGRLNISPVFGVRANGASRRLLAVVGASGSGKTSLVRAGVVATLLKDSKKSHGETSLKRLSEARVFILTPTDRPIRSLAVALTRNESSVLAATQLMDDLRADHRALDLYIARLLGDSSTDAILIVVDQFEELFTLCRDAEEQKAFVDNLLLASETSQGSKVYVLMTLRADFYAHCSKFDALRDCIASHQEYIGPMSESELRLAIEAPARESDLEFEPGLVTTIMEDIEDSPGALPLLSHVLLETWKRREGRRLTLRGYDESGRLRGAIAHTANEVYAQLSPADQNIARNILLRLTELGEGTQDTRRRARISELFPSPDDALAVQTVLKTLTDRRLVTTSEETAEVAHEALIREWPQLREWLSENREGLRTHRQLTEDAHEWEALGKSPDVLYRGAKLTVAAEWASKQPDRLNDLEREFLARSEAAQTLAREEHERQQKEKEDNLRRIAEAEKARAEERSRRLKWSRLLSLGLLFGLIVAVSATIYAVLQSRDTFTQKIAYKAINQASIESDSALLLARYVRLRDKNDLPEVREALIRANQCCPDQLVEMSRVHEDRVWAVAFHPVLTNVLASVSDDGFIVIWDVTARREISRIIGPASGAPIYSLAFSPDGKLLATSHANGEIVFWDTERYVKAGISLTGHDGNIHSIAFNMDGNQLVSGGADGQVIFWDVTSRRMLRAFKEHLNWVWSVAYSPDGRSAVSAGQNNVLQLYKQNEQSQWITVTSPYTGNTTYYASAAFLPDPLKSGKLILATGDTNKYLKLWDVSDWVKKGEKPKKPFVARQMSHTVWGLAFNKEGTLIGTGTGNGRVKFLHIKLTDPISATKLSDASLGMLAHTSGIWRVAFSADSKLLAAGSSDRSISLWQTDEATNHLRLEQAVGSELNNIPIDSAIFNTRTQTLIASGVGKLTGTLLVKQQNISTGQSTSTVVTVPHSVKYTAMSPDGNWLAAVGGINGEVNLSLWRVGADMSNVNTISASAHYTDVTAILFSPDSQKLVTGDRNGKVVVWDVVSSKLITSFIMDHRAQVRGLAFNLNGSLLATSGCFSLVTNEDDSYCSRAEVRIWRTSDWLPIRNLILAKTGYINAIAFHPDGKSLVTGSEDRAIEVWDIEKGQSQKKLLGQNRPIKALAMSADGNWLASGSDEYPILLWNLNTGQRVGDAFNEHDTAVTSLRLSPNGDMLVSTSKDGTAVVRDLRTQALSDRACRLVSRNFTQSEWEQLVGNADYQKVCN
jgi:WD40 repeat protein/ABC-type dipeptide/oligopeptide/nickel transport system ATPase component